MSVTLYIARVTIGGQFWEVELVPLQSVSVKVDGADVPGVRWDRQHLSSSARPIPPELGLELRAAISRVERGAR